MTAAGRNGGGPQGQERDESVTLPPTERLGRRGPGPVLVGALVVAAFLVGVVRPWDWLAPPGPGPGVTLTPTARGTGPVQTDSGSFPAAGGPAATSPRPAPRVDPTCAYPSSWRLAAIQEWGGRPARVWSATEAVAASGPDDPSIPFSVIASTAVTAVGWCAPVIGDERPPLAAVGTLFRVDVDSAREIPFDRLEPSAPDALGELWVPVPQSVGRRPPWPPGRYVIRLMAPGGSFERYLGIEVVRVVRDADPGAAPGPAAPEAVPPSASPTP